MNDSTDKMVNGFTLVEIMIITALIGLLAALAMPGFVKVRKQSQGKLIVNDARVIDTAVDAWAMEHSKVDGDSVDLVQAAQYLKTGALPANDIMGHAYIIGLVGTNQVRIAPATKNALAGVSVDWGAY